MLLSYRQHCIYRTLFIGSAPSQNDSMCFKNKDFFAG